MKVYGNVDLNLNTLTRFAVDVVDDFPSDPVVGRLIYKNDLATLFICTQTTPSALWIPLANKNLVYVHEQSVVSNEWVITHELDTTNVFVQVYTPTGYAIIPDEIIILDNSTVKILFSENSAGKAVIASLNSIAKLQKTSKEYVFTLSNQITFNHGLGYYPHVTIVDSTGQVVIPDRITHIDKNSLTVYFGDISISGTAIVS